MAYRKDFDETKYMSFFIKDDELVGKYNEIWNIVINNLKKEVDSGAVHNEKYLKALIKPYNGKCTLISTTTKYQMKVRNVFAY